MKTEKVWWEETLEREAEDEATCLAIAKLIDKHLEDAPHLNDKEIAAFRRIRARLIGRGVYHL